MSLALNEFQRAVYARLASQLTTPVYNHVPQGSPFPYVVTGYKTSVPWRTKTEDGQEITITIDVWSNAAGDKEAATLMGQVYAALDRQESALTMSGFTCVVIECGFTDLAPYTEDEGEPDHYYHGVMRFRALVETD